MKMDNFDRNWNRTNMVITAIFVVCVIGGIAQLFVAAHFIEKFW